MSGEWSDEELRHLLNEARAERDARSELNDTLSQIINDLCAERDALQALVCEIAVIRRGSLDGGGYAFLSADLLDRLDAAAKDEQ